LTKVYLVKRQHREKKPGQAGAEIVKKKLNEFPGDLKSEEFSRREAY
jgi:hypothetical protein